MRAGFKQLFNFRHYLFLCLADTGKSEQIGICAEKSSESVIEDKGNILVLVFARSVDGEYRRQYGSQFVGMFHKTSLISIEI